RVVPRLPLALRRRIVEHSVLTSDTGKIARTVGPLLCLLWAGHESVPVKTLPSQAKQRAPFIPCESFECRGFPRSSPTCSFVDERERLPRLFAIEPNPLTLT